MWEDFIKDNEELVETARAVGHSLPSGRNNEPMLVSMVIKEMVNSGDRYVVVKMEDETKITGVTRS